MTTHDYEYAIRDSRAADFQELCPGVSWERAQYLADEWKNATGGWESPDTAPRALVTTFLHRYGESGNGVGTPVL